jgi:phosphinothricin acetyltransferase
VTPAGARASIALRPAAAADLVAINDLYNHYVRTSTCTYQEEPDSIEDRRSWFEHHDVRHYPILVACLGSGDGELAGWGSLSPFRPRSAYRFAVEDSVYVRHDLHGRGIGSRLLGELIDRARRGGFRTIVAGIDAEQAASVTLHAKFGFVTTAHLKQVGIKYGRWLDVYYMQLMLDDNDRA